ncbi:MAG TPA: hypothetical protein VFC44_07615 [Candidatus Saccharimonadales bacterium]|nr:hypothetical protein [Candidatus Saccharimonadales bacterium]
MIQIIRQVCQKAGCQPKDLVLEWSPKNGTRLIGANPQSVKIYVNVLCPLEHIAHAIYLCVNGQEDLYPQFQQQQAAIAAKPKEKRAGKDAKMKDTLEARPQGGAAASNPGESVEKDWRQLTTVPEIVRSFPIHPSADDVIDLYQRNKKINSAHLQALLEKHSRSMAR